MHRFRKKSDVKRTQAPILPPPQLEQESNQGEEQSDFLLPVTDFRTSLILPDLSRRFSLLRTQTGDPVTLDDLRSKFAEQRAKGAEHSISEEEEDMLLETLGKLRGKSAASNHTPERSEESFSTSDAALTEESGSSTTIKLTKGSGSSTSGSPSRSKRYSNNLFGSGRLRDYTYLRSVGSSRNSAGGSSKAASITPSEESTTPHANTSSIADSVTSSSPPTDSNEEESVLSHPGTTANDQSSVLSASSSISEPVSAAEYRLQKSLGPTGLKRASLALESVIKEIEDEEVEEEIVLPRSTPIPRNHADHHPQYQNNGQHQRQLGDGFVRDSDASMLSSVVEAGMAISSDKPSDSSDSNAQRGASPVPIVPGYIPGMPRPMTPRAFETFADEQRSHSTTPRATSPMHGSFTLSEAGSAAASISNILRRDSTSSRQSPRPTTPLFLQRSTHGAHHSISSYTSNSSPSGRYTPMDDGRNRAATDLSSSTNSNSSSRRPASPLSNPPFHTISSVSSSPSRPTTPSNIVWAVREDVSPSSTSDRQGRHSRDNSWASEGESDTYGSGLGDTDDDINVGLGMASLNRTVSNGFSQPQRSPPLSDSPGPEKGQLSRSWTFKANGLSSNGARPISPSNGSNGDLGQSQMSPQRNHRSLTPTQNAPRSPSSPTFGGMEATTSRSPRRASRQNGYANSSPFNLGPLPTLALNARANRSSSSLESTGSSFHSWEGEKDKLLGVFNDAEVQPAWHEFSRSSSGKSLAPGVNGSSTTTSTRTSPEEAWDPEDIIQSYAGLKKGDFAMIQEKLVSVARTTEHRGSAMRKRRPSTSQSNYSVRDNRQVASPPPPASPTVNIYPNSREQQQIHVLNTCVEHNITPSPPIMAPSLSSSSSLDGRRNLAQVLFGQEEEPTELDTPTNPAPSLAHSSSVDATASIFSSLSRSSDTPEHNFHLASPNASIQGLPSPGSASLNRSLSATRVPPQTAQDQAALALEVRQKAEAATLALRKPPSQEGIHTQPSARKRIDPSQISKPLLVSSSTSVDTIPLKAPVLSAGNGSGSSLKIGSRFRKLRGSLRAKNVLSPEEPVTAGSDGKQSPNSQTASYDPERIKVPGTPNLASATEPARFKVPVPSPPASAGPGLKGFMARWRQKRNTAEIPQSSSSSISSDHHQPPQIPHTPLSPLGHPQRQFSSSSTQSRTPSHTATVDSTHTVTTPRPEQYRDQISNSVLPSQAESTTSDGTLPENDDTRAINQLFAAATNLGIDQAALNDLLKRSGSLNSRTLLNSNTDASSSRGNGAGQHLSVPPIQQPNLSSSSGSDYTATPGMFNSSPVSDLSTGNNFLYNEEPRVVEEPTERISAKRPDHLRQGKDINTETNPIVRRTLIFADPRQSMADPSMSRRGTVRRKRASVQSASNRSIHDRVPTPPPSKAPQGKRFSHEASPPVPRLPHALGGPADNHLTVPTGQFEKSNSAAYDSLYELYGDSRVPSMMVDANNSEFGREPHINSETATGVEVIQLANGDIIWNVVNGLRDEDDESLYTGRNSVGSEYSTRESGENMQVFVKEHVRGSSKGSNASFVSRKKPAAGKGRPETKVLYGSPEQIGRLIENISQGMDAGSFNFSPPYSSRSGHTQSHGHSTTSSVSTNEWNINEIDNLLNSINRP